MGWHLNAQAWICQKELTGQSHQRICSVFCSSQLRDCRRIFNIELCNDHHIAPNTSVSENPAGKFLGSLLLLA